MYFDENPLKSEQEPVGGRATLSFHLLVLGINDIFGADPDPRSVPLTNGSGSGS